MPDDRPTETARPDFSELHPDLRKAHLVTPPLHLKWAVPVFRLLGGVVKMPSLPGVRATEHTDRNGAHVRVYEPAERHSDAALLWMHGGGLIVGSPQQNNAICSQIARDLGILVVSAYYRLAPKHPFPAALDDCVAAWRWMHDNAEAFGVDATRIAIAGESAGAGLAACLAQRLHDEGGVQPRAQLLIYPMLNDRTAAHRELDDAGYLVWTNRSNRNGWSSYLGQDYGAADVPEYAVAARRKSLAGLPPAHIAVGTLDLFLGECREYARRLETSGVPCELSEIPGAPHGFIALAPDVPISRETVSAGIEFLERHLQD